jgi:ankyrin repeat protein
MQKEKPKTEAAKPHYRQLTETTKRFLEKIFGDQGLGKLREAIKNGLEPNDILEDGRPLLMHAAMWDRPDICRFLIQQGARIDATDPNEETAYSIAKRLGNAKVCSVILEESARMLARLAGNGAAKAALGAIESELGSKPRSRLAGGRRNN